MNTKLRHSGFINDAVNTGEFIGDMELSCPILTDVNEAGNEYEDKRYFDKSDQGTIISGPRVIRCKKRP